MAYVAVSGGEEAIEASIRLLDYYRSGTGKDLEIDALVHKFGLLIDKVMSESGLYEKEYAALALKQCEGFPEEAVFLLRAYRSTLKRSHYTNVADTKKMRIVRRISAAFKDIPGGQMITLIVLSTLSLRMKMPQSCIKSFKKSLQNRRRKKYSPADGFPIC